VLLYTEMITASAIIYGNRQRLLQFDPEEQPLALQLGGSDPAQLSIAARAGQDLGFCEINLNCGCPSDRVHTGAFGACLMMRPELVAECVEVMSASVSLPVTVKMRIGVVSGPQARLQVGRFDENDYQQLHSFTEKVAAAGCRRFIVHARKAVLGGLSPRENREVPPLRFDVVQRLRVDFPALSIGVNGGLRTVCQCRQALAWADGVMLGREAYHRPYLLAQLHRELFDGDWRCPEPAQLLERMAIYAQRQLCAGERLSSITRHMLGLCTGQPGARRFRQRLSEGARQIQPGPQASADAARLLRDVAGLCVAESMARV
ncbi:MAG TPA: tRNA dihydrouridine(20/20a) synthase DusA, partial [Steroidobacteraceae bacterium]|nr:tRNA dihydrouridine(20/20a) synthase DusA [Steroidobacteraceae bacterium]